MLQNNHRNLHAYVPLKRVLNNESTVPTSPCPLSLLKKQTPGELTGATTVGMIFFLTSLANMWPRSLQFLIAIQGL